MCKEKLVTYDKQRIALNFPTQSIREKKNSMKIPSFFRLLVFRLLPPCDEITLLISKGMDTRLSLRERWQLQLHLLLCEACSRFNIHIHTLHTLAQGIFQKEEDESSGALQSGISPHNRSAQAILTSEARKRIQTALNSAIDKA
jgi:hypothetical protein